jgi:SAM-dependent methyltransferase
MLQSPNKTLQWGDLVEPSVRQQKQALRGFLWREFVLKNTPVAVNGILRRRFYIRRLKMWEYARGLAALPPRHGGRVLDFGGGGTLPPFFIAAQGIPVQVLDIDQKLNQHSADLAQKRNWPLSVAHFDLSDPNLELPDDWVGAFDRIYSYCVVEHITIEGQKRVLTQLAKALRPGGGMVISFEFGADAPAEAPWHDLGLVEEMAQILQSQGVLRLEPSQFTDRGERYVLDKSFPDARFTFGMLVLEKPANPT